jgi:hypothetical protein
MVVRQDGDAEGCLSFNPTYEKQAKPAIRGAGAGGGRSREGLAAMRIRAALEELELTTEAGAAWERRTANCHYATAECAS